MSQLPEIIRSIERVGADVVRQAAAFQAAILCDVAGRRGAMHGRVAPVHPSMKMAGPAFTVEVRPGDNLMIHAAIALAQPGDVLVIDGKGDLTSALMGMLMLSACKQRGLAGVVLDGAVRDRLELLELGFPVFGIGFNPTGPTKRVPGRINHPVSAGGVVVHAGDLVVGDADGVVVVERAKAPALMALAQSKLADEAARIAAIARGETAAPWLPDALRAAGVLGPQETL
ncbi:RraA family protein [Verminephrobacter aporrectodeae]|uniref:Putative 4-hydroxy-4-methyl-2-oxoglutarate aldolase n=1 Tax=Verminephrobacter aporrectodeae subsp. tuberculatae TaxID=1110392 RepID=A0ABT3KQN6_9BURK|nr:diguanylate cyclase [Verminephrobacter aporrectodeae]MCW5220481.1 RraA family protein [Verminephrobacter aporrectodeae subsp. tuberculatae]MCW5289777.1 RraA family protein [Verminephrobacter aporrectodeae subsp. tuberculatae]MCW5320590.1 RraA family protein [Verminephrobacter aporrectodeae subsp. tuberculatae]MCW8166530.1 RraA family protein [Verminephrobacter aporrectodeae subsp. tuberculatae]MCW8170706.1 RraA family protein [Verminephrobacter aporrectodeae subsp. tuberculatae]